MKSQSRVPLTKQDVIRIDCIEKPEQFAKGEGLYEWRYDGDKYTVNLFDLLKEIEEHLPGRSADVSDRLMNFPRVYLIIPTGEVFSDTIPS